MSLWVLLQIESLTWLKVTFIKMSLVSLASAIKAVIRVLPWSGISLNSLHLNKNLNATRMSMDFHTFSKIVEHAISRNGLSDQSELLVQPNHIST